MFFPKLAEAFLSSFLYFLNQNLSWSHWVCNEKKSKQMYFSDVFLTWHNIIFIQRSTRHSLSVFPTSTRSWMGSQQHRSLTWKWDSDLASWRYRLEVISESALHMAPCFRSMEAHFFCSGHPASKWLSLFWLMPRAIKIHRVSVAQQWRFVFLHFHSWTWRMFQSPSHSYSW